MTTHPIWWKEEDKNGYGTDLHSFWKHLWYIGWKKFFSYRKGGFFHKVKNSAWTTSFFNLFIWLGIILLPLVLLLVYLDISSPINLYLLGIVVIIAKISLFWKSFSNFFEKIHGAFHLILYFCALEILPDFVLWKGIELVSNNLILKL